MKNKQILTLTAVLLIISIVLTACQSQTLPTGEEIMTEQGSIFLPDLGPAPDFQNDVWLNSEPLTLAELQGKVVLVEFWTFG